MNGDLTLGEIGRTLESHVKDSRSNHEALAKTLERQNEALSAILLQATKTNGRVTALEKDIVTKSEQLEAHAKSISHFRDREKYTLGALAIIGMVLLSFPFIAQLFIKDTIRQTFSEYNINVN